LTRDGNAVHCGQQGAAENEGFLWGAQVDNGLKDVTKFDYNDTMGPTGRPPIKTNTR
jgi:hypothetical protein